MLRLAFFNEGRTLYSGTSANTGKQCANPAFVRSVPACCAADAPTSVRTNFGPECLFTNEAMSYDQAEARCQAQNYTTCSDPSGTLTWSRSCAQSVYAWTSAPCNHYYPRSTFLLLCSSPTCNIQNKIFFRVHLNERAT